MLWKIYLLFGALYLLFQYAESQEILKASQCFKSLGIPKVDFECSQDEMIKINKAFHGIASENRDYSFNPNMGNNQGEPSCMPNLGQEYTNCSFCAGDCVDDSMNLVYDWSTCMGNTSCLRTVMQSYMPACTGRDKFSDYLQVEYQCIPRSNIIDICSSTTQWLSEGYIMSPNYPEHYPVNTDCSCRIQTDYNSRITLSFYDLLLETKQVAGFSGRCRADWLMLRQNNQKHRHCGAIMTGTKNITSDDSVITLQFHSDENDNRTQKFQYFSRRLKGFWLYFTAEPQASMQIVCQKLTPNDPEVQEIYTDDADYNEVINTSNSTDIKNTKPTTTPPTKNVDNNTDNNGLQQGTENEVNAQGANTGITTMISTINILLALSLFLSLT